MLRYVVLRADAGGRVLALIVTTSAAPRQPLVSAAVALVRHGIHGVLWSQNDATSGTILGEAPELLDGSAALSETIAGVTIDVSATEFLQVNREQAERLYAAVAERSGAGAGTRAVELYTADVAREAAFYDRVFGWETCAMPLPGGVYTGINPAGEDEEAIFGGMVALADDPTGTETEPYWLPYFATDDVDGVVDRARELGGAVRMAPVDIEGVGRTAKLADPYGARFAVIKGTRPQD